MKNSKYFVWAPEKKKKSLLKRCFLIIQTTVILCQNSLKILICDYTEDWNFQTLLSLPWVQKSLVSNSFFCFFSWGHKLNNTAQRPLNPFDWSDLQSPALVNKHTHTQSNYKKKDKETLLFNPPLYEKKEFKQLCVSVNVCVQPTVL